MMSRIFEPTHYMKPIVSVKEARKLLGEDHESMTDEGVAELVEQLHELAKLSLYMAQERLAKDERSKDPVQKTLGQK